MLRHLVAICAIAVGVAFSGLASAQDKGDEFPKCHNAHFEDTSKPLMFLITFTG